MAEDSWLSMQASSWRPHVRARLWEQTEWGDHSPTQPRPPGAALQCPYIHPTLPCWHCGHLWCLKLERAGSQTWLCHGFTCDPKHLPASLCLSFPTYPARILGIIISKGPSGSIGPPALFICCLAFSASWLPECQRRCRCANVVLSGTLPSAHPISGDKLWLARKVIIFFSRAYFLFWAVIQLPV